VFCPQCIYVFCVDLRRNSDYFCIPHQLTGFITEVECLQRGTDWVFKSERYSFIFTKFILCDNPSFPFLCYQQCTARRSCKNCHFRASKLWLICTHFARRQNPIRNCFWVVRNVLARFRQVGYTTSWHAGHWSNRRLTITENCPHFHWWGC
jgi:hypothetical protein